MKKTLSKKLNWYELSEYRGTIYGLSCISIILFHYSCRLLQCLTGRLGTLNEIYNKLISSSGVDIFVLMSGMCMYFAFCKNEDVKRFYGRRLKRVLIPYFIIAIPFYVYAHIFIRHAGVKDILQDISFLTFFTKGNRNIWFICFIALMYIIYPIIYHIYKRYGNHKLAVLLVSLLFVLIMDAIICIGAPTLYTNIEIMLTRIPTFLIGTYVGMKAYEKESVKKSEYLCYGVVCVIYLIVRYISYMSSEELHIAFQRYILHVSGLVYLGVIVITIHVFKMLKQKAFKDREETKNRINIIEWFGKYSLELYLAHVLILKVMMYHNCYFMSIKTFIIFMVFTLITAVIMDRIYVAIIQCYEILMVAVHKRIYKRRVVKLTGISNPVKYFDY